MSVIEINNLTTEFATSQGQVKAVRDVSYKLEKGEILGIVGESGSGKSVGMLSLMGLLAENGQVKSGEIIFQGEDISPCHPTYSGKKEVYEKKMRSIRGKDIGMIFQDPMSYLNPVLKIGKQMTEGMMVHTGISKKEAYKKAIALMEQVGIPSPEKRIHQYPFEFSGGMRQRIIIAIALAGNPQLLIADEPTTALDVTVQAQILDLIKSIRDQRGTSVIMITHDLGVVSEICDRIAIMYAGKVVEVGLLDEIFYDPKHPYTVGLLKCVYKNDGGSKATLVPIAGTPPDLLALNTGCAFAARCEDAMQICMDYMPANKDFSQTHACSCWKYCKDQAMAIIQDAEAKKVGGGHEA